MDLINENAQKGNIRQI